MSFKFVIYTVPDCSECQDAKDLIKSQGMTFGECSLETQEQIDDAVIPNLPAAPVNE